MDSNLGLQSTDLRQSAIQNVPGLHKKPTLNQVLDGLNRTTWKNSNSALLKRFMNILWTFLFVQNVKI